MDKKTIRFLITGTSLTAVLVAVLLVASQSSATPQAATLSGQVSLPAPPGTLVVPVPNGTIVWLYKMDRSVHGWAQVTADTGAFSFPQIPPGHYLIRAVPPEISGYTPSLIEPVTVFTAPVNVGLLYLTNPSITGTVYLPGGNLPTQARVFVYAGPQVVEIRNTLPAGQFAIGGLPPHTYTLAADPLLDAWWWWSRPVTAAIVPSETHSVSLTLQAPQVFGVVRDDQGAAVGSATVHAVSLAGGERRSDLAGFHGRFAIGGLPAGPAVLKAEPPPHLAGLIPVTQTLTLPHTRPITLTLQTSPKVVTGVVTTNNPATPVVQNAQVVASRIGPPGRESALSDASGRYALRLAPGLWALSVKPVTTSVPSHWVYPRPPQLLQFDNDKKPEVKRLDFKVLTADATVVGAVELPGGGAPPFTVTVGLHTDEGVGVKQDVDANGRFTFSLPHHVYQVDVRVGSPEFAPPPIAPIFAAPLATTVVPTITLIARDATITGTLTISGAGAPIEGVPVTAWNPNTHAAFPARSAPNGVYVAMVYTGTWLVQPAPMAEQPYLYTGEPQEVSLAAGQVVGNVDFELLSADATLHGVLVTPHGDVAVDARGWGKAVNTADPDIRNGAPVKYGEFDILVPGGATYAVTPRLADGGSYVYVGDPQTVTVGAGGLASLVFTLTAKNTAFAGALWDGRQDRAVPNLPGQVWAWNGDLALNSDIDTGNGTFVLRVPAGLWGLNYRIPEDSDYVKLVGARYYGLDPIHNRIQLVKLPVAKKDGRLTGVVLLSDGSPAAGATAVAEGLTPEVQKLVLRAQVGNDGAFSMTLPSGGYIVRATRYSDESLINPVARHVFVPPAKLGGPISVTLQYRAPDTTISGQVALSGTSGLTGTATVFAWTNHGGFNQVQAELGSTYAMPVISNTLWHMAAVYETRSEYWEARATVPVTTAAVTRDLVLEGPFTKPAPVSVLFDPTVDQDIELPDHTRIHIPAGAMPVDSGNVLLHITPLAGAPHHHNGDVLGLAYAFEAFDEDGQPITENFDQDVTIVFKYHPAMLLAMGLNINHLRPAYFSTTTNSWTAPESFVADETRREIAMQIDHFTWYGVLNVGMPSQVFAPVTLK